MLKKFLMKRAMKKMTKNAQTTVRRAVKDAKKSLASVRMPIKVTISR